MAIFSIDFSGETTGAAPANFTERWTSTGETWAVREKAGALGGKCLEHTRTTTARRLFSWDTPGTDADEEVLVRWRSTATNNDQFWLVLRGAGSAGSEDGYVFRNASATSILIARVVAGTLTTIGAAVTIPTLVANEWFWMRFRVNGSDLKAKIWAGEHLSEPAAWTIERTDTNITGAGWLGVGNVASTGTRDYDDIAAGTAGDTAAFPVSAEARVTQQVMLALSAAASDARITQLAALVLGEEITGAPIRVTQATLLALAEFEAGVRVTQAALLALVDQVPCVTRWAQTWTITRTDGEVFAFTSLDRPLTFRGVAHLPCASLSATATEQSTSIGQNGSMELLGIISEVGISERDLYNGLFDFARFEIWMVPWDNAGGEIPFRLLGGTTGTMSHGLDGFKFEVLTASAQLRQRGLLEVFSPSCRYGFGNSRDARCPVDLVALTVTGSATTTTLPAASNAATRRVLIDSTRAEVAGYFDLGIITFTTGANAGASSEIKRFESGVFVLWSPLLFPIEVGDAYSATPGCNKTTEDHLKYNADLLDFGGFPDVPGSDAINQSPDAKG